MAIDPNMLSRNELVQLLNSTPLGESITRSRVGREMNRPGRRWHDARHVRFLDYLRWLVGELDRPRPAKVDHVEARRRQARIASLDLRRGPT